MNALRDQLLAALSTAMQGTGATADLSAVQENLRQAELAPGLKNFLSSLVGSGSPGAVQLPTRNQVLEAISGLTARLGPEERRRLDSVIDHLGQTLGGSGQTQEAVRTLKAALEQSQP